MTIVYLTIFHLIITTLFVYGQDLLNPDECIPVYKLLGKEQSNNCCSEKGITCKYGHITRILLSDNKLNGPIPSAIGNLSRLEYLDLSNNRLNGSIPKELGQLSQLENLSLQMNNFIGQIPKELGNLTKLHTLNLNDNKLNGAIPSELINLVDLYICDFSFNDLCGVVPELPDCKINVEYNENIGKKCPVVEIQQNKDINDTNNKTSPNIILIIVGIVCALLLILIILAYLKYNKINKKNKKNKSDNDYTFIEDKYFEWKIENWSQLKDEEYSPAFEAYQHLWKLMLITDNLESIDVGLSLCDEINDNEYIYANFVIYFRNYNNTKVYKEVQYDDKPTFYNANLLNHGINDAILKSELYDKMDDGCSLLENNKIIVGILIKFYSPNPITITNGN